MRHSVCLVAAVAVFGSSAAVRAAEPAVASTVTVDRLTTQNFGDYFQSAGGGVGIPVLGIPGTYTLHDGTTWTSGAGGFGPNASATATSVSVTGTTIRYTLGNLTAPDLMNYTDYDSGSHSSEGVLDPFGPLVLTATVGSTTATLTSTLLVAANPLSNYTDSRYNYYTAPVGTVVPFSVTYQLSGSTWQANTFSTTFQARPEGLVRFDQYTAVPEPATTAVVAIAAVAAAGRRRNR